jgi:hypothetical protein
VRLYSFQYIPGAFADGHHRHYSRFNLRLGHGSCPPLFLKSDQTTPKLLKASTLQPLLEVSVRVLPRSDVFVSCRDPYHPHRAPDSKLRMAHGLAGGLMRPKSHRSSFKLQESVSFLLPRQKNSCRPVVGPRIYCIRTRRPQPVCCDCKRPLVRWRSR